MAEITKSTLGVDLTTPIPGDTNRTPPLTAGEALARGDLCAVRSDGKAWRTDGTVTGVFGTTAQVDGICLKQTPVGEKVSLYFEVDVAYAAGLTPGTFLYASGTVKGGMADAAVAQNPEPCGRVYPADAPDTRQRVRILKTQGRAIV